MVLDTCVLLSLQTSVIGVPGALSPVFIANLHLQLDEVVVCISNLSATNIAQCNLPASATVAELEQYVLHEFELVQVDFLTKGGIALQRTERLENHDVLT